MPEYLAPGVYVEETSYRAKTIEGVSTSTAGFVGATRFGPTQGEPELLTSFAEFERIFGGLDALSWGGDVHNFLAHGVRAFFDEGGRRLYVTRVWAPTADGVAATDADSGYARLTIDEQVNDEISESEDAEALVFVARYPGSGGNVRLSFAVKVGQDVLAAVPADPSSPSSHLLPVLKGPAAHDTVLLNRASPPEEILCRLEAYFDEGEGRDSFKLVAEDASEILVSELDPSVDTVQVVTVNVSIRFPGRLGRVETWEGLTFHPAHRSSLSEVFAADLASRRAQLTVPVIFTAPSSMEGPEIARILLDQARPASEEPRLRNLLGGDPDLELPPSADLTIFETLSSPDLSDSDRVATFQLTEGDDGRRPGASAFEGVGDDDPSEVSGLKAFELIPDISIVAAPGHTFDYHGKVYVKGVAEDSLEDYEPEADQIIRHLIGHCERMRYRIAVLDSVPEQTVGEVRGFRGLLDSKHAALYYPWVRTMDPITARPQSFPPSGYIAGIYARNDVENGVHKAPANEVVRSAIGFEVSINKSQQDVLNPEGVNCLRFFQGRGYRVWGARTISSDPEWKYVNLRRYFAYLERSIEVGTQWVVFENNHEPLWAKVRRTIEDFLFNEWKSGHLMGEKPEKAYFVRCDRSTMTQNDIDNGRLICLIGVSPVRPAEFVIFRIGQWTADAS